MKLRTVQYYVSQKKKEIFRPQQKVNLPLYHPPGEAQVDFGHFSYLNNSRDMIDALKLTGHCIRFQNKHYKTMDTQGLQVYYHRGVEGLVIQSFTGELLFSTHDKIYALDEVPLHEQTSRNFDFKNTNEKPKKRNIPSPKHPWRSSVFKKHVSYDLLPDEAYFS